MGGTDVAEPGEGLPFLTGRSAVVVVDDRAVVLFWSPEAEHLLGHRAGDAGALSLTGLLAGSGTGHGPLAGDGPADGTVLLRHADGRYLGLYYQTLPLRAADDRACAAWAVLLADPADMREWRQDRAMMRALFAQRLIGLVFTDPDLRRVRSNTSPRETEGDAGPEPGQEPWTPHGFLRRVLDTGEPQISLEQPAQPRKATARDRSYTLVALPLHDADGQPMGTVTAYVDVTEREDTRRRFTVLQAAADIGSSLDVTRTAQQVVDALVPEFAQHAAVELDVSVLTGNEPPLGSSEAMPSLRRVAAARAGGDWPAGLVAPGDVVPAFPQIPELWSLRKGKALRLPDLAGFKARLGDPAVLGRFFPPDAHCAVVSPLYARGLILGYTTVMRAHGVPCFDAEDVGLVNEIASRAALGLDNARRYTREHRLAVALQRSLLPPALTDTSGANSVGSYSPADSAAGVGGDWYDVIPLSSLRVAFVIGDVFGHGLQASATMGRLRTAVQTLAELDLEPGELLARLDDLVLRLAGEDVRRDAQEGPAPELGGTVLYAVYDPVTRRCAAACAGHPPPVLIGPDGTARVFEIIPGPPLGVGGMPFETQEIFVEEGSLLAFYTDGVVKRSPGGIEEGLRTLTRRLSESHVRGTPLPDMGNELLGSMLPASPTDDAALLLARTRGVPEEGIASWELSRDLSAVGQARRLAAGKLAEWGLDELTFTVELVVSELVTNAARYAGGPIGLRLMRDRVLVCEVSDPSNSQPRLIRARSMDEGGRGLFLVAQMTDRWGCRYGRTGKTIWTELAIGRY